jgi:5-methylcytosine-specific restriction endonuclease McrA
MAWKRYGDPLARRRPTPRDAPDPAIPGERICSVAGCERPHYGQGYCNLHWQRRRRTGDPLLTLRDREEARVCSVEGCNEPHKANGYCGFHNARVKQRGTPGPAERQRMPAEGSCRIPGCKRPVTHGLDQLCDRHYKRKWRYGDPEAGGRLREPGQRCELPGCESKHYSQGLCKSHYAAVFERFRRSSAPGETSSEQLSARIDFYGNRCYLCGTQADEIDHVIPVARGGSNWPANLRPICKSCNSSKKDRWKGIQDLLERRRIEAEVRTLP